MQKGRFLLALVVSLSTAIIISSCAGAVGAQGHSAQYTKSSTPSAYATGDLRLPSGRRYIGTERPDWLFETMAEIRTKQGSGPVPDVQLTPTATASEELYADSAPQGELNRIVISSNGVDENGDGEIDPDVTADNFNLWLLRVDGTLATQLTDMPGDEMNPAYDPGGRLVAFSNNSSGTWQIYTVEVLTGTIRQVTDSPGNKFHPTWSPDGLRIAFSGDMNGNRDLFWIPSDGSELPQAITFTPENEIQPEWSPTATVGTGQILFTRTGMGGSRIFRIDYTGEHEEQVTNGGGDPIVNDTDPAWRHDGQLIAFASDRPTEPADLNNDYNIWTVSPAGEDTVDASPRSNLDPEDTHSDRYPTFNPGLNPREPVRIFFTSSRPDQYGAEPDIWRFEDRDPVPPELVDLPWVDAERRYTPPGTDITVHVEVFDRDSGVQQVVAEFKDPDVAEDDSQGIDHKLNHYITFSSSTWASEVVSGDVAMEYDCDTVGRTELFDDGDPAHGDAEAGDGIFSGVWTTPPSPSDFIIDIHVSDVAGNNFEYDDIYGFTTQQWQPKTRVLLVDDYCEGQAFPWNASFENNDLPTQYPKESYYTTNPGDSPEADNEAFNTFRGGVSGEAAGSVLGEGYDIWRIICRGPITMPDLIYYLPTTEMQLSVPDMQEPREVLVANRCVVWAAPHTGNVWTAPGSLVDASTQATLATFLDRGGRMMISGQDIGFALTLDGTSPNAFFNNYLHSTYVRDSAGGECHLALEGLSLPTAAYPREITGTDGDPVARHPGWTYHWYPPMTLHTGVWEHSNTCWPQDASIATVWPDVIQAGSEAVVTHRYPGGETAGLRYQQGRNGYRVVYFAWGFEQTHREYDVTTNPPGWGVCKNYRSKLMHNTLCYLRTAGFQGRVLSISDGNQPINDPTPIVQVFDGGELVAAVECEEDGRYVMGGLAPDVYELRAIRPGFDIDHADNEHTHGGFEYPVVDFAIVRAEPGAIRGRVTALATGEPLATVQVCAYETIEPEPEEGEDEEDGNGGTATAQNGDDEDEGPQRGDLIKCTTTDADGTYLLGDIDIGNVIVEADGGNIGYGTDEAVVTVTSGNTATVDLALEAAPGTLIVTVTDTDGNPLQDATVAVLTDGELVDEGITDEAGIATFELSPDGYMVEVTAPGYERSDPEAVTLTAAETTEVTVQVHSQPPGSVSGLIARGVTGEPVGGMTVELVVGNSVIDTTTTAATTSTAPDGSPYNYRFTDVPTGQVIVRPQPIGFTVSPQLIRTEVATDEETTAINFSVSSIRRFPEGLQLISLPWDYPNVDPAELLNANPATFQMAAWDPGNGRYALYPSTPGDRFRLGSGYWLKLHEVRELSREGVEAEDVYEVELDGANSGWNLFGDFFRSPIDFYALTVREPNGVEHTVQEAMAEGLIRSPLFAYVLGGYTASAVAEQYVGYWLNVGADLTIVGNRMTDTLAADEEALRPAVVNPEQGWLMPLVVESGQMRDNSTWVGCAPSATTGFDPGMDMLKPPPPGMASTVYAAVDSSGGAQAVDVRPAGGAEWTVQVQGPPGRTVALRWPDMSSVPREVRPILTDTVSGREIYMRTSQGFEFTAGESARRLEIRLLDDEGTLTLSTPSARAVGAGAEISYTLSADATVSIDVMNIAGRVVGNVVEGGLQSAGRHRVNWNGITTRGTRAPAGMYLVVVRARGNNGQQTEAIGRFALGR